MEAQDKNDIPLRRCLWLCLFLMNYKGDIKWETCVKRRCKSHGDCLWHTQNLLQLCYSIQHWTSKYPMGPEKSLNRKVLKRISIALACEIVYETVFVTPLFLILMTHNGGHQVANMCRQAACVFCWLPSFFVTPLRTAFLLGTSFSIIWVF